jgi:hypothetical protein
MILTEEEKVSFDKITKPLIKYMAKTFHPHCTIVITNNSAEILESSRKIVTDEFIE